MQLWNIAPLGACNGSSRISLTNTGMFCSRCGTKNRESAKFCIGCGHELVRPASESTHDIGHYPSVFQDVHHLRYQEIQSGSRQQADSRFPLSSHSPDHPQGSVGRERNIPLALLLSLVSCGIYGFVWMYRIGIDLRDRLGPQGPQPGVDVFLTILTCGLWGLVVAYRYPKMIDQIERMTGLPESRLSLTCLLLSVFGVWKVYGLGLVSLALMQHELNTIWRAPRDGGHA